MRNSSLDDIEFLCSVCRRTYLGKHINNKWEAVPICDWCSIPVGLRESGRTKIPGFWMTSGTVGEPESFKTEWIPERELPPNPSEVN